MGAMKHTALAVWITVLSASGAAAQDAARADYFRSVSSFFNLPPNEVAILSDWDIAPAEIPVVLFVARRAGVSPEALVALRSSGQSWAELTARYRVTAAALHVPLRDDADARALDGAYRDFRATPVGDWGAIRLDDGLIVGLVNVRVLSQTLNLPPERVLAGAEPGVPWVTLHARLKR